MQLVSSRTIPAEETVVTQLFANDEYILVGLDNSEVYVLRPDNKHINTFRVSQGGVWGLEVWGEVLVATGTDGSLQVWDIRSGEKLHDLRGHSATVRCIQRSNPNIIASGSKDTTVRIWDLQTGKCLFILGGHSSTVYCVTSVGDLLVSGSADSTARIWNISNGDCLFILQGHSDSIRAVVLHQNTVITASIDSTVRVWDLSDGTCTATIFNHAGPVSKLQLMQDSFLVSASADGWTRVWSLTSFTEEESAQTHSHGITALAVQDRTILVGGKEGEDPDDACGTNASVKIWNTAEKTAPHQLGSLATAVWQLRVQRESLFAAVQKRGKIVIEIWSL